MTEEESSGSEFVPGASNMSKYKYRESRTSMHVHRHTRMLQDTQARMPEILPPIKDRLTKKFVKNLIACFMVLVFFVSVLSLTIWPITEEEFEGRRVPMKHYHLQLSSRLHSIELSNSTDFIEFPIQDDTYLVDFMILLEKVELENDVCEERFVKWQFLSDTEEIDVEGRLKVRCSNEAEFFEPIDVTDLKNLKIRIFGQSESPKNLGFFFQPREIKKFGSYRIILGSVLFCLTVIVIMTEVIHRIYATFLGSTFGLLIVALTYGKQEIRDVMAHIDFHVLMLLFSMMIYVHLIALTGFFEFLAARVVKVSRSNVTVVYVLLTTLTAIMSAFLDNVATILLMGPVTISVCRSLKRNPVPFYLSETILGTIGGTLTLIGDPPNVVIGSELNIDFNSFLIYNGPLIMILVPIAVTFLFLCFRKQVSGKVEADVVKLVEENQIRNRPMCCKVLAIFLIIVLGLLLSTVHGQQPGWLTTCGMFLACIILVPHDFHSVLEAVEWDTLLFFALFFVMVGVITELQIIYTITESLRSVILGLDTESQKVSVTMAVVLWISSLGSAFLESLPYTTTMVRLIRHLGHDEDIPHKVTKSLPFSLSVGACIGGIGSIMGSSANLVSMAISRRYADPQKPNEVIEGKHFLIYGFPLLILMTCVASVYQYIVFSPDLIDGSSAL